MATTVYKNFQVRKNYRLKGSPLIFSKSLNLWIEVFLSVVVALDKSKR